MSAGCLSNVCLSSPNPNYKMGTHETSSDPIQKQSFSFLRRTFSADMLAVDHPADVSIKRAQSSDKLDFLGKDDDHDLDRDRDQEEINGGGCEKKGAFEDIWSSIQKNGGSGSGAGSGCDVAQPYVHPLVKRSGSLLSQKSLEICTESLGSETGSETGLDGLSTYPVSDPGAGGGCRDGGEGLKMKVTTGMIINHGGDGFAGKCTGAAVVPSIRRTLSSPAAVVPVSPSSFPPPLPSLSHREGSANLQMRSLRRDGRLVVEAVAVPSVNRLRAHRRDGRLLLVLGGDKAEDEEDDVGEMEEVPAEKDYQNVVDGDDHDHDHDEDDQDEEEEEGEMAIVMETKNGTFKTTSSSSSVLMSKIMELAATKNRSAWPRNFNATILNQDDVVSSAAATLAKSQLPPRPVRLVSAAAPVTDSTATVLNAYEYYWRRRGNVAAATATVAVLKPLAGQKRNNSSTTTVHVGPQVGKDAAHKNKLLLAHGEKREYEDEQGAELEKGGILKMEENLVPWLRGCKEPNSGRRRSRRSSSLLFWDSSEPAYCIATS